MHSTMDCLSTLESQHLVPFLNWNTKWELYCTGRAICISVRKSVSTSVLLRFAMVQVSAMDCFRRLKSNQYFWQWRERNFRLQMHELAGVLQKGLKFHERSPGPLVRYRRYAENRYYLESNQTTPDQLPLSLARYVKSTWHPSLRNVGILMVTRKQYKHASGHRTREEFDVGRRILAIEPCRRALFLRFLSDIQIEMGHPACEFTHIWVNCEGGPVAPGRVRDRSGVSASGQVRRWNRCTHENRL